MDTVEYEIDLLEKRCGEGYSGSLLISETCTPKPRHQRHHETFLSSIDFIKTTEDWEAYMSISEQLQLPLDLDGNNSRQYEICQLENIKKEILCFNFA